ncbi:GNAT family N-acetyltransferase [Changchengzhania lutea]|uniref:GNAT family N-acetyltransferase n=1 Tax=Changchengzhania lutea TaxID=2049305 RepID=UPI00115EF781|nr:GNAT family protein [Changchengzhania lutea]
MNFDAYHISPIKSSDAWKVCNFIISNEDRLKTYFPNTLKQNLTPELSKKFVEKKVKQFELEEEYLFTIKTIETSEIVGLVYIKEIDCTTKQGEFAYCIGYPYTGKGITAKAIHLLSDYAFNDLGLKRLQIIVYKDNLASIQVAKNNNFTWIKTLKNEFTPIGSKPLDMELYELYHEFEQ